MKEMATHIKRLNSCFKRADLQNGSIYTIIENYLTSDLFVKRFEKFPEVLLLQVKGRYEQFDDKIDLSKFSINPDSKNIQHSKYMERALCHPINSFKLSDVFMTENLSIPVTFCKLDDHAVNKTMLFPVICPFPLNELNKI